MPGGTAEDDNVPKPKIHVSTIHASQERIKVFVRVRPLVHRELTETGGAGEVATRCDPSARSVAVRSRTGTSTCTFDGVFPPETTQEQVFAQVRDCVLSVTEGFNATCFAYGQTGSGKTFTMFGDDASGDIYSSAATIPRSAGIIPRAVRDILSHVRSSKDTCTCYVSFMQIYNEQVFDLLRDPGRATSLAVKEDSRLGIFVEGLSEFAVESEHDCLRLLRAGDERRAVRSTRMNDLSSRSHSVFQMVLEQRRGGNKGGGGGGGGSGQKVNGGGRGHVVRSKLNLVDLAGSEKWDVHEEIGVAHISELTNINKSLHTLSRCIEALAKKDSESSYVPYRESKLTRLLQDSLGGSAKTRLFAMLSPSSACAREAQATLRFADCAKRVMQHVTIKETRAIDHVLVNRLEREVQELRAKLRVQAQQQQHRQQGVGSNLSSVDGIPALPSSMSSPQLGTVTATDETGGPASLASGHVPVPPQVIVKTVASSEVLEELAQYRKKCASLESILEAIDTCANRFFRFEIEEEEMETEMVGHLRRAKVIRKKRIDQVVAPELLPGALSSSSSSSSDFTGGSARVGSESSVPRLKGPVGKKSTTRGLKFRIRSSGTPAGSGAKLVGSRRGGGGGSGGGLTAAVRQGVNGADSPWMTDEQKQGVLEARLKEANRKMAKQKKLQAWLAEKSRREKEALDEQMELEEARRKAIEDAEQRRKERNRANKEKLADWRQQQIEELNALLGSEEQSAVPELPEV